MADILWRMPAKYPDRRPCMLLGGKMKNKKNKILKIIAYIMAAIVLAIAIYGVITAVRWMI